MAEVVENDQYYLLGLELNCLAKRLLTAFIADKSMRQGQEAGFTLLIKFDKPSLLFREKTSWS